MRKCVISKVANDNGWHDLQTSNIWHENPYGSSFAIVPDDMIDDIMETRGYCDIELNKDGKTLKSFTPRAIPVFPDTELKPSKIDMLEAQITYTAMMTDTLLEE